MGQDDVAHGLANSLNSAILQVLDIRQAAAEAHETIAASATQSATPAQAAAALQALASKIELLAGNWPTQVAPALQRAEGSKATTPERIEIDLTGSAPVTDTAAAAAVVGHTNQASDSSNGSAGVVLLRDALRVLELHLGSELMCPVNRLHHDRKRPRFGLGPTEQSSQIPSTSPLAISSPLRTPPGLGVELQQVVLRVRAACPEAQVMLASSSGQLNCLPKDALEVRLCHPRVMVAFIALSNPGTCTAVQVSVDVPERLQDGSAWTPSPHVVFKRVQALASRALTYFTWRANVLIELGEGGTGGGLGGVGLAIGAGMTPGVDGMSTGPGMTPLATTPPPPAADAMDVVKTEGGVGPASAGRGQVSSIGSRTSTGGTPNPLVTANGVALEDLLLWLCSYRELFTRPCTATGQLLALEPLMQQPVPPVFRPFKLSRSELLEVASQPNAVKAYHTAFAPIEMLGWDQDDGFGQ